jgi:hypothetical protein
MLLASLMVKRIFFPLLDTKLGIMHWVDCSGEIENKSYIERITGHTYDWAHADEEWRFHGPAWPIFDCFEVLKHQYRELLWFPITPLTLHDSCEPSVYGEDGVLPLILSTYRQYGWPDIGRFHTKDCQKAIYKALGESYPVFISLWEYENYDGEYYEDD